MCNENDIQFTNGSDDVTIRSTYTIKKGNRRDNERKKVVQL